MDEEIYFAQCVVFSLNTIRIGMFQACIHAKETYERCPPLLYSLFDKLENLSDHDLSVYRELHTGIMPVMQTSVNCMNLYKSFILICFEKNHKCLSLPKELDARSYELWSSILETKKALMSLSEILDLLQEIYEEFLNLIRSMNVLHS